MRLQIEKVKQSEILLISFLISLLQNTPRLLELVGVIKHEENLNIVTATISVVVFRMSFLFAFSWLVLQYNCNLYLYFKKFGKVVTFTTSLLFNGAVLYVFTAFYYVLYDDFTGKSLFIGDLRLLSFILIVLLFGLVALSKILRYKIQIRVDLEERERLIKQNLQNELAALKNQINPHFLFNSLNSLNYLIRDNKVATKFVHQLSFMYRYILQSGHQDLVNIEEELKFINSYVFLIKTRYRDKFNIEIEIDDSFYSVMIPVLTLQLLVENTVKHNEISAKNPLKVRVYIDNDSIVVENKIKQRSAFVDSTGQGLVNIDKRYKLLKNKNIHISNENDFFRVKLPLK